MPPRETAMPGAHDDARDYNDTGKRGVKPGAALGIESLDSNKIENILS
jgi:hypothetical protein